MSTKSTKSTNYIFSHFKPYLLNYVNYWGIIWILPQKYPLLTCETEKPFSFRIHNSNMTPM